MNSDCDNSEGTYLCSCHQGQELTLLYCLVPEKVRRLNLIQQRLTRNKAMKRAMQVTKISALILTSVLTEFMTVILMQHVTIESQRLPASAMKERFPTDSRSILSA